MKYLVLLGDGMADFPLEDYGNKTPLELAATPAMDAAAAAGICAPFCPIPEGLPPGSEIGNLAVFGYNPVDVFTGRAPMEAASQGIRLAPDEVAFRCNLVTLDDGTMRSFTAGHITNAEGGQLVEALNTALDGLPVRFHPGVGYRNLAVVKAGEASVEALCAMATIPPHNITDQPYAPSLPSGDGAELIRTIMERSQSVLADHAVNRDRRATGHLPATSVWLWGQGRSPSFSTYQDLYGLTGAVISAVDLVKGIGLLAGLDVIDVPGATGYIDTDYEGKVRAALTALETRDFVYLHVEAPDETAHEGRADLKIQAIEDFDKRVVAPCLDYLSVAGACRLFIGPDHITSIRTKTHAAGPVPFILCGDGIEPNGIRSYSEKAAEGAGRVVEAGYTVVPNMIRQRHISLNSLCGP